MGVNPLIWGPALWALFHLVAYMHMLTQPDDVEKIEQTARFFESIPFVLPCPSCSMHCTHMFSETPPPVRDTAGTKKLFQWTVDVHNKVNERVGKPAVSYNQAEIALAENMRFEREEWGMDQSKLVEKMTKEVEKKTAQLQEHEKQLAAAKELSFATGLTAVVCFVVLTCVCAYVIATRTAGRRKTAQRA